MCLLLTMIRSIVNENFSLRDDFQHLKHVTHDAASTAALFLLDYPLPSLSSLSSFSF